MNNKVIQKILYGLGVSSWVVVVLLGIAGSLIGFAIVYFVLQVSGDHAAGFLESPLGQLIFMALIYVIGCLIVVIPYLFMNVRGRHILARLGLTKRPTGRAIALAAAFWFIGYILSMLVMLTLTFLPLTGIDLTQKQEVGFENLKTIFEYVAAFIALCIIAPIAEEAIFRGFLYDRLRTHFHFITSMLITSFIFAFVHLQVNVGIDVFILSLFLCYLRERYVSLWPGIFLHSLKNSVAYFFLFIAPLIGINLIQ